MSYDNPNRIKYRFHVSNLEGDTVQHYAFQGPIGKNGKIFDYGVEGVVTAINGTATVGTGPDISVGVAAGDVDAYGEELTMVTAVDISRSVRSINDIGTAAGQTAIDALIIAEIPADTEAALVLDEGDASTGEFTAFVIVDWAW